MKSFIKWLAIILLTVMVLSVIGVMIIAYAVFSPEKINKPAASTADENAVSSVNMKLGMAVFAIYAAKENNSSATQTVELTEAEFNAFITQQMGTGGAGDIASGMANDDRIKDLWLLVKNNSFVFTYSKNAFWTPFGSYLNGEGVADVSIKDGRMNIKVKKAYLGKIGMPESFMQKTVDSQMDQFRKSGTHTMLIKTIEKLEIKDGKIVIVYRPYELKKLIGEKLMESGVILKQRTK